MRLAAGVGYGLILLLSQPFRILSRMHGDGGNLDHAVCCHWLRQIGAFRIWIIFRKNVKRFCGENNPLDCFLILPGNAV